MFKISLEAFFNKEYAAEFFPLMESPFDFFPLYFIYWRHQTFPLVIKRRNSITVLKRYVAWAIGQRWLCQRPLL